MQRKILGSVPDLKRLTAWLLALNESALPIEVTVKKHQPRRKDNQNDALYAHLRDIARSTWNKMDVPDRVVERVKADFKRTDIWPKYSDPEPDYFTGEVLYRPKSCADLSTAEAAGILQWLEHYMHEHGIKSHAPIDQWTA